MKHLKILIRKLSVVGGDIFNIFEYACFLNWDLIESNCLHIQRNRPKPLTYIFIEEM